MLCAARYCMAQQVVLLVAKKIRWATNLGAAIVIFLHHVAPYFPRSPGAQHQRGVTAIPLAAYGQAVNRKTLTKAEYLALVRDLRDTCSKRPTEVLRPPVRATKVASVLDALFDYHGSDRGSVHHKYGAVYDSVFGQKRCEVRNVLEIGIGSVGARTPGSMAEYRDTKDARYRPGPSLRVWRDFFPFAHIVGWDIDADAVRQAQEAAREDEEEDSPSSRRPGRAQEAAREDEEDGGEPEAHVDEDAALVDEKGMVSSSGPQAPGNQSETTSTKVALSQKSNSRDRTSEQLELVPGGGPRVVRRLPRGRISTAQVSSVDKMAVDTWMAQNHFWTDTAIPQKSTSIV
ncbi:unnamed protein product [Amoebophrya sp. A120]|nr:unnamed protein product [Amoebophrya sp. A120]|eukprot:GSA120T00022757001.1